jgi:hypothetical protein
VLLKAIDGYSTINGDEVLTSDDFALAALLLGRQGVWDNPIPCFSRPGFECIEEMEPRAELESAACRLLHLYYVIGSKCLLPHLT